MEKKTVKKSEVGIKMMVPVDAEEMSWLVWRAFERGDAKRLGELLAAGGDANAPAPRKAQMWGYKELNLLGVACARRSPLALINALLKGGADPNAPQHGDKSSALHVLLSSETDLELDEPDLTDMKRGPALAKRARALIKAGANPNLVSSSGETPLLIALEGLAAPAREPVVAELLSLGAKFREGGGEELTRCVDDASPPCGHHIEDTIAVFGRLVAAGAKLDDKGPWSAQGLRARAKADRPEALAFVERYLESLEIEASTQGASKQSARRGKRPGI